MQDTNGRIRSFEIQTVCHKVLCHCGAGYMVGDGSVRLVGDRYEHQHKCIFFGHEFSKKGCGATEWFPDKYPLREEREIKLVQHKEQPNEG